MSGGGGGGSDPSPTISREAPDGYGTIASANSAAGTSARVGELIDYHGWQGYHWVILCAVASVKALCGACVGSFPFLVEELQVEFGASRTVMASVAGCLLLGSIVGVLAGGSISDAIGRRAVLLGGAVLGTLVATLHVAITALWHLFLVRLLMGVAFGSIVAVMNVYLVEQVPSDSRGWCICMASLGWKLGAVWSTALAWMMQRRWRLVLAGPILPGLIAIMVFTLYAPESARWLMTQGRDAEAHVVLKRMFPPGSDLPRSPRQTPKVLSASGVLEDEVAAGILDRVRSLFSPGARFATLLTIFMWVINVGSSYSWGLWCPEILKILLNAERLPYEIFVAGEVLGAVCVLITAMFIDKVGRRPVLVGCFLTVAILIAMFKALPPTYAAISIIFLAITWPWEMLWAAKIAYTKEAFATELRGTATGVVQFWGRISGALVPIGIGWLLDAYGVIAAVVSISTAMGIAGCVAMLIPFETSGKQLIDKV